MLAPQRRRRRPRAATRATLKPFVYKSKGTLAALGHFKGVGRVYKFRIYGFVAWWVWRTYYLMQMPQWSRRLRIVLDWTVALMFKNDVVQLDFARYVDRPAETSDAPGHDAERDPAPPAPGGISSAGRHGSAAPGCCGRAPPSPRPQDRPFTRNLGVT